MRVLFAISILALVALLWATVSMARHIRRARRRRKRAAEFLTSHSAEADAFGGPSQDISQTELLFGENGPQKAAAAPAPIDRSEAAPEAVAFVPAREPQAQVERILEQSLLQTEPELAVTTDLPSGPEASSTGHISAPHDNGVGLLPVSGQQAQEVAMAIPGRSWTSKGRPVQRADWGYFNKDMGDLTDPYETPRQHPVGSSRGSSSSATRQKDTA